MEPINDGGPIFPHRKYNDSDQQGHPTIFDPGMSLRDYFAAHAPEVPGWFAPIMPTKQPELKYREKKTGYILTAQEYDTIKPIGNFEVGDFDGSRAKWGMDYNIQSIAQWSFFYADAMLAAREVQHG